MNRGIYPVLAGAVVRERHLELLAHNLGNLQTAGFKQDQPVFGTMLARAVGAPVPGMDQYPQLADVRPDQSQGTLRTTGRDLDVALEGPGFFVVLTADGIRHFRGGSFHVDDQQQLVTHTGDPVLGAGGPITVRAGDITIDRGGTVRVNNAVVATLRIETVPESVVPVKAGDLYWILPGQTEEARNTRVHQGSLEQTNVNASLAMVDLIKVQRGYEQMEKAMQTMDELTGQVIQSSRIQG